MRSTKAIDRSNSRSERTVSDVLLVVITIVFFGVAVLLVRACDAIIGPDEEDLIDGNEQGANLAPLAPPDPDAGPDADSQAGNEPILTGVAS